MASRPLIVLNAAGLSSSLVDPAACPGLARFLAACGPRTVAPVLPAVTAAMQATLTTGALPAEHGIVGNGFYDRTLQEHRFWCASAGLLERPRFWERESARRLKVATLFWWNLQGSLLNAYLNVAPFHLADGSTVPACASRPADLYGRLEAELGAFPLHRFWGPAVSIESSAWILDATLKVAEWFKPDLVLSYLPHMDYSLQRSGPGSADAREHLAQLDRLLARTLDAALAKELDLVLLSEYGISPVSRFASPNRVLKQAGLFQVRRLKTREYPDLPGSRAFAICDHQIAHVYVADRRDLADVKALLEASAGVAAVLDEPAKRAEGISHPRAGDLVALAEADSWFEHSWWTAAEEAPDYANTVDIHRKIGFDPLELIPGEGKGRIAAHPGLVRGSHGLVPRAASFWPIIASPYLESHCGREAAPVPATEVAGVLLKILEHRSRRL